MSQNHTMDAFDDIKRKVVDVTGILVSFYDACRDRILKSNHMSARGQSARSSESPYCVIGKGSVDATLNLLQFIRVQDDSRINSVLRITKRI